jgi:hypothetical protein
MGKFDNIYPRGVVIDQEKSATVIRPTKSVMPEGASKNMVFWLNKNGFVYKTVLDALRFTDKIPSTAGMSESLAKYFLSNAELNPSAGEKAYFHRKTLYHALTMAENSEISGHFVRVTTIDVPYALPVSTKPGERSTVWISKSDRAYATRKLALEDNIANSIPFEAATSNLSSLSSFFKSSWLWILLVCIVFYLISKNKKYGKQLKSSGGLAAVPALPE